MHNQAKSFHIQPPPYAYRLSIGDTDTDRVDRGGWVVALCPIAGLGSGATARVAPTYADISGFCASVGIDRVRDLDYVLTPGRYVGLPDDEDDFDFKERFTQLKAEFAAQLQEEARLNALIAESLGRVK